ncbi:phosphoenolpyruvate carboxylase [Pseudonocardia sp. TMWB2A]|uniref:phosphoenolpyruvate carboxylase n=1 Tax=Pseudonocardia sp. TMWB2A TaxID=687430 RepID=UPI00307ECF94
MSNRLRERLVELHQRTVETPLFNPVFQLSLELSRDVESGALSLDAIQGMVAELGCEALQARALRLHHLLAPTAIADNETAFARLVATLDQDTESETFAGFSARWSRPLQHIVFTAHPTFLLTPDEADAVAERAGVGRIDADMCVAYPQRKPITLAYEHRDVLTALAHAQDARDMLVGAILDAARARFPDQWRELLPVPYRFATWVGYDMDGRTDIGWPTSLRHRLIEKAERLRRYAAALEGVTPAQQICDTLAASAAYCETLIPLFTDRLDEAGTLTQAANHLTADHPARLTSLKPVIAELRALAVDATDTDAKTLLITAAAMEADGLGMGWIHFRVNSAQLLNAIRIRIDPDNQLDMSGGAALMRLRDLLAGAQPLRSNIAALAVESTTAVRQFLAMAQILRHIDADAPIRMLIAECETPHTVLAALYFSKLFGIDDRVDISPLFETESAMEHGGRFIDALLREPDYRDYVQRRGRIAIQTGFSDAGRFVGQIPAALGIERLHSRLAELMVAHELTGVAALIFNTHGESMGRGAHPKDMENRLTYPMSVWARGKFAGAGIRLEPEVSFQGGDGFLPFRTKVLALATLTRIAEVEAQNWGPVSDPFYERTDLSLDYYRQIRHVQRDHLVSKSYARAITAFGLGLLVETGSRKSRRQSDLAADREISLRQIRAIPHNAVLQQLGYPVNVIAGAGTAAANELDAIVDLIGASPRAQQVIATVQSANVPASIKTVAAYGELFNSAFWATRPYRGNEERIADACLALSEHLVADDRLGAFRRLASRLRIDGLKLHRLLDRLPAFEAGPDREERRRSLGILHALRLALMQHMFLLAVRVPPFSRANDISRSDVLDMILSLRVDDALAQLRRAFPNSGPRVADFHLDEPSDYPEGEAQTYADIHQRYINPIDRSYRLILEIGVSIANHFGAHG